MAAAMRMNVNPSSALVSGLSGVVSAAGGAVSLANIPVTGQTATIAPALVFSIPMARSSTGSAGIELTAINVAYTVVAANVTSIVASLSTIGWNPGSTSSAVALTNPAWTLSPGTYVGNVAVTTPAYENNAYQDGFQLTLTITLSTAAFVQVVINGIEMLYNQQNTN